MKEYKSMSVGQIVADRFDNATVFKKYGIDFLKKALTEA